MVTKKVNNTLAFLLQNISRSPRDVKARCYESLVCPNLEYASSVWNPYTMVSIQQLEAVQRCAARYVSGEYHTKCFTHDEHHRLEVLSTLPPTIQVFMLYRITNQLFAIPIQPYPQPSSVTTRGLHLRYMILFCQTDIYSRSYFPSTIRLWNQIPHKVVTCPTLVTFNGRVATIMSDQGF